MFPEKERLIALLEDVIKETDLLFKMSEQIKIPDDFVTDMSGMILFRACSMSLQYITECFVKIKNLCGMDYFKPYSSIPWQSVFGMRNFLSHGYGDVDSEGIFNTIKTDIPALLSVTEKMLSDLTD
ncbi:MAG: DUF86 domain-containing protein [Bacteroidales bacterium]|nr:DUF86 domain-containing protein [Bacteroidales bacterium]MBQ4196224.1 DUF86 domain-containing protein [Bacteroidales bacterium]